MIKPTPTSKSEPGLKSIFHDTYKDCQIPELSEYQLGNMTNPTAYSVDCLFQVPPRRSGSRCDEFIFCGLKKNKTGMYLVERKTRGENIGKVKNQLQGGASFIKDFLKKDKATYNQPYDFMPVWVSKGLRSTTRKRLKSAKVSIQNRTKRIQYCEREKTLPGFQQ